MLWSFNFFVLQLINYIFLSNLHFNSVLAILIQRYPWSTPGANFLAIILFKLIKLFMKLQSTKTVPLIAHNHHTNGPKLGLLYNFVGEPIRTRRMCDVSLKDITTCHCVLRGITMVFFIHYIQGYFIGTGIMIQWFTNTSALKQKNIDPYSDEFSKKNYNRTKNTLSTTNLCLYFVVHTA